VEEDLTMGLCSAEFHFAVFVNISILNARVMVHATEAQDLSQQGVEISRHAISDNDDTTRRQTRMKSPNLEQQSEEQSAHESSNVEM
jgi:hypothetical protein